MAVKNTLEKLRRIKWFPVISAITLVILTLAARICVAYFLASDEPGDGRVYAQLATNLLEQNAYSLQTQAPFDPTLVRLPGYPLFIAAVYAVFGHGNDSAVRLAQAVIDTATCVIIAIIAWQWTENEERRKKTAFWAFLLAALCPFVVIYTATILTETLTTFLMAAMTLTATFALKSKTSRKSPAWWIFTGLLAGAAVTLRPDSGLFAAGIGLTLVISGLFLREENSLSNAESQPKFARRLLNVGWRSAVFSLAFILVLAPWTIRNERLFGVFQPLAPAHAEMPGEFVPRGYQRWLRTWIDESRYVEPMLWNLNEKPINIKQIPASAFDSEDERQRVAALLEIYNQKPPAEAKNRQTDSADSANSDDASADSSDDAANSDDDKSNDNQSNEAAGNKDDDNQSTDDDNPDGDDENAAQTVKMTPEIDAGFAAVADERIARAPVRYSVFLPVKRAAAMWFDTHSLYYPFGGEISPTDNLDYDEHQQIWLPIFAVVMWIYTLAALVGAFVLWRNRKNRNSLRWFLLVVLMTVPRIVFFSTIENPEARYVVELFAFAAVLGGIFLGQLKLKRKDEACVSAEIPSSPNRLLALDVFRGITISAMVLVNSPGTWTAIYSPLEHAEWHGATPTDFVFPFFLFIVGISITLALGKRSENCSANREIYLKIVKRAFVIYLLGLFLAMFPFYNFSKGEWIDPSTVRLMGVLPRIAICYLVSALIFVRTNWKQQATIAAALLLIYWALMTLINVPGCAVTTFDDKACNPAAFIDRLILTENHIWKYSKVYDPEGLLSTVPAIATTLIGVLTGHWLRQKREDTEKVAGVFFAGVCLTAVGWIWSFWFPLNKSLWTSSYTVYTAGLALCFLGFCYWLIDIKGYKKWAKPFVTFGTNALALYFGSSIMQRFLETIELSDIHGKTISLQEAIFNKIFLSVASPINASLAYAISFVLVWLFLMRLLYRKRIFIKV